VATSKEVKHVEEAFKKIQWAYRSIDDGRVMKQEILVTDGMEKLKHAIWDMERAVRELRRAGT
jgi:hypothetical protein